MSAKALAGPVRRRISAQVGTSRFSSGGEGSRYGSKGCRCGFTTPWPRLARGNRGCRLLADRRADKLRHKRDAIEVRGEAAHIGDRMTTGLHAFSTMVADTNSRRAADGIARRARLPNTVRLLDGQTRAIRHLAEIGRESKSSHVVRECVVICDWILVVNSNVVVHGTGKAASRRGPCRLEARVQ